MNCSPVGFEELCDRIISGIADGADLSLFRKMLEKDPALLDNYAWQMRVHSELMHDSLIRSHALAAANLSAPEESCPIGAAKFSAAFRFKKVAVAIAASLLVGVTLWMAAGNSQRPTGDGRFAQEVAPAVGLRSPVEILHHWGSCNLEVPERLPGTLRMTNGRIKARLASGIELLLFGPFKMEITTPKEARLVSGRMLADIPLERGGFTLRTPDLEMWDNGALFSVSVTEGGSDVFVFKGEVQVVEACGEPVDICRDGEGARVRRDNRSAVKVAADWPYALEMLARVEKKGALNDPEDALWVASRVSDIWAERWMPKVVKRPKPVPGLRGRLQSAAASGQSAVGSRQSGVLSPGSATIASKGAVSRPSDNLTSGGVSPAAVKTIAALMPQNEEAEMKVTTKTVAALAGAAVMGVGTAWAVPVVSNVSMAQIPGTRQVQITYDLTGESAIVTLSIETNGVAIPDSAVTILSGEVCKEVAVGDGKIIYWNAGADWPENVTDSAKARVTAWSVDAPPSYCAVNVTAGASASSYPVTYYPSADAVPGGVTNAAYKTNLILMRRVDPTGGVGFWMGSPANENFRNAARESQVQVFLSKGYYVGVYEVTQSQWQKVMDSWPSNWSHNDYRLTRPVENVSYHDVRENTDNTPISPNWPVSNAVGSDSFMGRLRVKTGLAGFDLPTEAQWEYACRAGTTGAMGDGTVNLSVFESDPVMDALGRYKHN
ncbi:MAG: SUMF1/EgtB/PvdO family nonheme iron enzyme, partial [Kiritimatiellae bacterium]|nr:SUMF1/EgtB/PvdO family nonheme iron enzyme [Kiritimatiellia bacterium]